MLTLPGTKFSAQQPHDGSQPTLVGSEALFWCKVVHAHRALIYIKGREREKKEKVGEGSGDALGKQRQEDLYELETHLVCRVNSRTAKVT